ncbi:MAG: hypothetical protein ACE144_19365 [Thermodesulfobacteriota bacterium]
MKELKSKAKKPQPGLKETGKKKSATKGCICHCSCKCSDESAYNNTHENAADSARNTPSNWCGCGDLEGALRYAYNMA